jgi:sulfotransferase
MHRRNPFQVNGRINFLDEMLVKSNIPLTDENRCKFLMSDNGIVGQSYNGIRQALMQGRQRQLHLVEYHDLVSNPQETMCKLYEFLGEPYYDHDFGNLQDNHPHNDSDVYGFADMHVVRETVESTSPDPKEILPQSILEACANSEFWRLIDQEISEQPDSEINMTLQSENDEKLIGA